MSLTMSVIQQFYYTYSLFGVVCSAECNSLFYFLLVAIQASPLTMIGGHLNISKSIFYHENKTFLLFFQNIICSHNIIDNVTNQLIHLVQSIFFFLELNRLKILWLGSTKHLALCFQSFFWIHCNNSIFLNPLLWFILCSIS